jgi:acyl-CoA thioesterase-1
MVHWVTYGLRSLRNKAVAGMLLVLATAASAEKVHILALGDSLTQGYGLFDDEGFVPQLRGWLAARGHDVRIVNGGVSGDTTAGGLARVEWSLTPEIEAMIVALGGNDLLRGIDPAVSRANLEGILKIAEVRGLEVLLIGMSAPGNYGPEYKRDFDALYPQLADTYGTVYLDSFFAGLMQSGTSLADVGQFMQSDGIHPSASGVAQIIEAVGPKVEELIARVQAAD